MRFAKGEKFWQIEADSAIPSDDGSMKIFPVFSEAFLYETVGKGDARFILAVADEYAMLIQLLGVEKIKELLEEAKKSGFMGLHETYPNV